MTHMTRWLALVAFVASGCGSVVVPFDAVLPDALDKLDFVPLEYAALTASPSADPSTVPSNLASREPPFYAQTTVLTGPTAGGFTGLPQTGVTSRVRFEVTENFLIAHPTSAHVVDDGSMGGTPWLDERVGDPLAVYHIGSHFDIVRIHDAMRDGLVEDSSRPWFQRRYMRVDWSQNLVDRYHSVLVSDEWDGSVSSAPVPVYINNPADPNAPIFQYTGEGSQRSLTYFDVINRAVLTPPTFNLGPGMSAVPMCQLMAPTDPTAAAPSATVCGPGEVTVRQAFRRVDLTRDYEPSSTSDPLTHACVVDADCPGSGHCDTASEECIPAAGAVSDATRFGAEATTPAASGLIAPWLSLSAGRAFAERHNLWQWHHVLVLGADTDALCNADADCAGGAVCHIGNTPRDASHRGACAPIGAAHASDPGVDAAFQCDVDEDCRPGDDGHGLSYTATCDTASHTCQDRFVRCSAESDCAAVDPNSHCDIAIAYTRNDNLGLCTLPFVQRQLRPIAFHETAGYPASVQAATESVLRAWNAAFVRAIGAARVRECATLAHGGPLNGATADDAIAACDTDAVRGADARFVVVGCHAPVLGADPAVAGHSDPYDGHALTQAEVDAWHARGWDVSACGPQGASARLGDLRYDALVALDAAHPAGAWGLANVSADPVTGEAVASRAVVWQPATDARAAFVSRLAGAYLGEDVPASALWADPALAMGSGANGASSQGLDAPLRAPGAIDRFDLARTGLPARTPPAMSAPSADQTLYSLDPEAHPGLLFQALNRIANARLLGDGTNLGAAILASLAGSALETQLVDADQSLLAPSAAGVAAASPFQGQSPNARAFFARLRGALSAWECDMADESDDADVARFASRLVRGAPIDPADPAAAAVAFGGAPDASGRPSGQPWRFVRPDGTTDHDLLTRYLTLWLHQGLLAHEVGHALGASHDFAGSADAVNYDDAYWQHRVSGHTPHTVAGASDHGLRPRYDYVNDPAEHNSYDSPEEISAGVEDLTTSSVMDVQSVTASGRGPGRYDRAFVAHAYVGMVEALRRVGSMDGALQYAFNTAGRGESTPLDLRAWPAIHGLHYTQIPQLFGMHADGTPDLADDNRYPVFVRETRTVAVTGWGLRPGGASNVTLDGAHVLVPYRAGSDADVGLVWQVQRGDTGADAYESVHSVATRWNDRYMEDSFAHVGGGLDLAAHVARAWDRYEMPLRQTAARMALDLTEYGTLFGALPTWDRYASDPDERGGAVNQIAMGLAADAFVAQLLMPDAGVHSYTTLADGTVALVPGAVFDGVPVSVPVGHFYDSSVLGGALIRVGDFYDKTDAVVGLSNPEIYVLGAASPTDLHLFQLGFYAMFPGQIIHLVGGVLADDFDDIAPLVQRAAAADGSHPIAPTHLATLDLAASHPVGPDYAPIDPHTGLTISAWLSTFTMAMIPTFADTTFADLARVWLDGSPGAPPPTDPPAVTVAFTDPWTHETYRALHASALSGVGASVGASATVHLALGAAADETGIGARMLLHAQDLDAARLAAVAAADPAAGAIQTAERTYIARLAGQRAVSSALPDPVMVPLH